MRILVWRNAGGIYLYAVLVMKDLNRIVLRVFLYLLPLVILAAGLEYTARHLPNSYILKKECFEDYLSKNKLEVLILGDSHVLHGLDPREFSMNAFNMAEDGQYLEYDLGLLKKYRDRMPDLKYLVLRVGTRAFFCQIGDTSDMQQAYEYTIYYGIDHLPWSIENHLELFHIRGIEKRLFNAKKMREEYDPSLRGYSPHFVQDKSMRKDVVCTGREDCNCPGLRRVRTHLPHKPEEGWTVNTRYLEEIIQICREMNVKLVLLHCPCFDWYRAHQNEEQTEQLRILCRSLAAENKDIYFLDLLDDPDFVRDDYYDVNHLLDNGAKKFSRKVNDFLLSIDGK